MPISLSIIASTISDAPPPTDDHEQQRRSAREPRTNICAAVEVVGQEGADQAFALVVDVSDHGLRIRTPQPPPDDAEVVLRIGVDDSIHEVRARVCHTLVLGPRVFDVGLEFLGLGEDQLSHLRKALARAL